jgi:hypothetical protein
VMVSDEIGFDSVSAMDALNPKWKICTLLTLL